jgi:hypothetical protein
MWTNKNLTFGTSMMTPNQFFFFFFFKKDKKKNKKWGWVRPPPWTPRGGLANHPLGTLGVAKPPSVVWGWFRPPPWLHGVAKPPSVPTRVPTPLGTKPPPWLHGGGSVPTGGAHPLGHQGWLSHPQRCQGWWPSHLAKPPPFFVFFF